MKYFILFSLLIFGACAKVNITDAEVCGDEGYDGAVCYHTMTSATRTIPKAEWDIERFGMLCTQASNFANWKSEIEKLCNAGNNCTYNVQVQSFFSNVQKFQNKTTVTKSPSTTTTTK